MRLREQGLAILLFWGGGEIEKAKEGDTVKGEGKRSRFGSFRETAESFERKRQELLFTFLHE